MEETISIINKKKQKLAAVIHRPSTQGQFPAVILLAGFRRTKEDENIKQLATTLARNNIIAIRFDPSGFGDSDGETEKEYRLSNYISDTEAVYNFLTTLPDIDNNRIGLFGHSLGGTLAVIFAAHHPQIQASVIVAAPYTLRSEHRLKNVWLDWETKGYLEIERHNKKEKIPFAFLTDADAYDGLEDVTKIKTPSLFILGTKDVNVLPEETKALYEKANQPKELFVVEDMEHFYDRNPETLETVNNRIVRFYKQNL